MGMTAEPPSALAEPYALAAQGDFRGAIDAATRILRREKSFGLLSAAARWRVQGFSPAQEGSGPPAWPPALPDPFPGERGIPCVEAGEVTADMLGGAILHHGMLRVNGLVPDAAADTLRLGVDRALAARDAYRASGQASEDAWYTRLDLPRMEDERNFVEKGGAVWVADCPVMLHDIIDLYGSIGLIDSIAGYMGERPALSVGKSTLRRVPVTTGTDWHQDGAFLGRGCRAVNVWLALSPCGVDAAGLDVVARRLPYIVQTGSHGAWFDWSVGPGLVDMLAEGGAPVLSPAFAPGDALLFDHMMLHRTGIRPGMTRDRWAIESWFFAPTNYPMEQVPLLV